MLCLVYILVETAWDKNAIMKGTFVCLSHSQPVLISFGSSRSHVGKSVQSQRKREYLKCLASLSRIIAWECECLRSCVLCLVHISLKVSTSTRDENVNQASHLPIFLTTIDLFLSRLEAFGDMSVNQSRAKGNENISNVLPRYRGFSHENVNVYIRAYFVSFTSR